ncbi:hypothetical protein [Streptomyces sp. NPDC015125]
MSATSDTVRRQDAEAGVPPAGGRHAVPGRLAAAREASEASEASD